MRRVGGGQGGVVERGAGVSCGEGGRGNDGLGGLHMGGAEVIVGVEGGRRRVTSIWLTEGNTPYPPLS